MRNGGREPLARARRRLAMGDVDAAGILYFAAPYRWHEELFSSWFATVGHPVSGMLRGGTASPCVGSSAGYSVPLALDDAIELCLSPASVGRTSFALTTTAYRVADAVAAVTVTSHHVWSLFSPGAPATALRAEPLPTWLRELLAGAPRAPAPGPGRAARPHTMGAEIGTDDSTETSTGGRR